MLTGSGCYPPTITGPQHGQKAQTEGPPSPGQLVASVVNPQGRDTPTCGGGQKRCVHSDEVTERPDLLQGQLLHTEGG